MKKIFFIALSFALTAILFMFQPEWFKFLWGWQILLMPFTAGALMILMQNENRIVNFLPKLFIGSVFSGFLIAAILQNMDRMVNGDDGLPWLELLYYVSSFALSLTALILFGGLIGLIIKGSYLLITKTQLSTNKKPTLKK